jgi:26S proteasome regulatory subunit T1
VTYDDVGGAEDAIEKLREVVEMPLLHPERFVSLGIDPPKGVLLYVKNLFCFFRFLFFSVLE